LAIQSRPPDRRAVCLSIARSLALGAGAGLRPELARADPRGPSSALAVMQTEGPRSMDPANHTATLTATILDPMYEGLVRQIAAADMAPLLATRWTSSADGRTWTFTLRDGVHFHDGASLNAAAVVTSFRRLIDPSAALAATGKFLPIIAAVDAVNERQVQFRLKKPYADFLTLLGANQASVVSPRAIAAGAISQRASGTGPFEFVAWRSGESVIQRRNRRYWGAAAPVETLKWAWSSEPSVLYMALRAGEADIAAPLSPVFASRAATNPSLRLIHQTGTAFFWIALNTRLAPLNDPRVRQALNYATNRPALVAGLLRGFGQPASAPLANATPYVHPDPGHVRYDPAYARRLLVQSGQARGLRIAVAVQEADEPLAEALQAMWIDVGVDLQIRRLEGGVYASAAFASVSVKAAEGLGGVLSSWSSGIVPDLQLRPLFSAASSAPAGANLGFFRDPLVDRLLDAAAGATDPGERDRLYATVQRRIIDAAPAVWLYTRDDLVGVRRGVAGVSVRPGGELIVSTATPA
jgi:glutathione transport system substrate-binding protein